MGTHWAKEEKSTGFPLSWSPILWNKLSNRNIGLERWLMLDHQMTPLETITILDSTIPCFMPLFHGHRNKMLPAGRLRSRWSRMFKLQHKWNLGKPANETFPTYTCGERTSIITTPYGTATSLYPMCGWKQFLLRSVETVNTKNN